MMASFFAVAYPTHSCILKFLTITFLFVTALCPSNLCEAESSFEIFKLRKGLKFSYYNADADTLDLPTLDAYEQDPSSLIASPPINHDYSLSLAPSPSPLAQAPNYSPQIAPTPSPYTDSHISDPPQHGSGPYHNSPLSPPEPTESMHPKPAPQPTGAPGHKPSPSYALWCVARPTIPEAQVQRAMDYACGAGADCKPIQPNGLCFLPNTLVAHASYAFNAYWQRTKIAGGTCDFGGTAMLITVDPSYDECHFVYM